MRQFGRHDLESRGSTISLFRCAMVASCLSRDTRLGDVSEFCWFVEECWRSIFLGRYQGISSTKVGVMLDRRWAEAYRGCGCANRMSVCSTLLCRYHRGLRVGRCCTFQNTSDHRNIFGHRWNRSRDISVETFAETFDFIIDRTVFRSLRDRVWNVHRGNRGDLAMNNLFDINIDRYKRNKWSMEESIFMEVFFFFIYRFRSSYVVGKHWQRSITFGHSKF